MATDYRGDPLPPFSGHDACCPKCGSGPLVTAYHWAGGVWAPDKKMAGGESPCKDGMGNGPDNEHLCRVCRRCGYGWSEQCADAPVPPDGNWTWKAEVTRALPAASGD